MTGPAVSPRTARTARTAVPDASLYAEVAWCYARQMHWIDEGDIERWAATFTEEAVFHLPTRPQPMRGRAELVAGARTAAAVSAAAGERRRHVVSLVDVTRRPEGTLEVGTSVVVHAVRTDGASRVEQVCVCADTLVRSGGELLVSRRRITPAGAA